MCKWRNASVPHVFLSYRLLSSVKNNVGRGLNIALVNGMVNKQVINEHVNCIILRSHSLTDVSLLQGWQGNSWRRSHLICGQEVIKYMNWNLDHMFHIWHMTHEPQFILHVITVFRCCSTVEVPAAPPWGNPRVRGLLRWSSYQVIIHDAISVPVLLPLSPPLDTLIN